MTNQSIDEATTLTGMDAVKEALRRNPKGERSLAWLASEIGCTRGAPSQWDRIPEDRIEAVARVMGMSPRILRPDLAELFSEKTEGAA